MAIRGHGEGGNLYLSFDATRKFNEGDKVRDKAGVGGQVLETWGNGVKVSWRNGHTGWIDERFLTLDRA